MKRYAFNLIETMVTMVIVGIIAAGLLGVMKKTTINDDTLKKMGTSFYLHIEFASRTILAKYTTNYSFLTLKAIDGSKFSITDSGADAKLAPLFKKMLAGMRRKTLTSLYLTTALKNSAGSSIGLTPSSFTQGFVSKSGAYVGFKLNGNCTTTESNIYNPATPDNRSATKSCGLIFFDVNSDTEPNVLGIDQYIISIGKLGLN